MDECEPILQSSEETTTELNNSLKSVKRNSWLVLEPAVLLLLFALNLSSTIFQNQVIYQVCTATFGYNSSDCKEMGTKGATEESRAIEQRIQPYASIILMAGTLLENVIPAIICLFIGSWSDKFGRKPVILAAYLGFFIKYFLSALISFISDKTVINPWIYIVILIPESILGGNSCFSVGCVCYITDTVKDQQQPLRLAIYEVCIYLGLLIGALCSSYIYLATSATTVFIISATIISVLIAWLSIFLKDNNEIREQHPNLKLSEIFNCIRIIETWHSCVKKRPNYDRIIAWLIIANLGIFGFVLTGQGTIFYLFTREKFGWTIKEYTTYEAVGILTQVFGSAVGILLFRKIFSFSAISIALVSSASAILDSVTKGTATQSWHLFLAMGLGTFKGVVAPMSFSMLSAIVTPQDMGKVFSLTNSVQSLVPLGSSPLYTLVYNHTYEWYSGAFNFISTGVFFICFLFLSFRPQTLKDWHCNMLIVMVKARKIGN